MKIEHFAINVKEPTAMAQWWSENLGLSIIRADQEAPFIHFLSDDGNQTLIEIYANPTIDVPPYQDMDPLTLHLAFVCENIPQALDRLQKAGATIAVETMITPLGDELVMLRDPWGMAIQLCNRAQRLV